jgi:hypothetical protein
MPAPLMRMIRELARAEGSSISGLITAAIADRLVRNRDYYRALGVRSLDFEDLESATES